MESLLVRMKLEKLGAALRAERKALKAALDLELEDLGCLEKTVQALALAVAKIRFAVNAKLPQRASPRDREHFHSFRERRQTISRVAGDPPSIDLQLRKASAAAGTQLAGCSPRGLPTSERSGDRTAAAGAAAGASARSHLLSKRQSARLADGCPRVSGSFVLDCRQPAPARPGPKENLWAAGLRNRLAAPARDRSSDKDSSRVLACCSTPLKPLALNALATLHKASGSAQQTQPPGRPTEKKTLAGLSGTLAPPTALKPCTPRQRLAPPPDNDRSDSRLLDRTNLSKLLNRTDDRAAGKATDVPDDATEIEFDTHSEIEQSTPIGRKVEKKLAVPSSQHRDRGSIVSSKKLLLRHAGLRGEQTTGMEQAHNSEMSLVELNYSPSRSSIDSKIYIMNNQTSVSTFGIKMNKLRFDRPAQRGNQGYLNQTLDS